MQPVTKLCELDNVANEELVTKTVFVTDDSLPDFETKLTEKSITEKSVEIQDDDWLFFTVQQAIYILGGAISFLVKLTTFFLNVFQFLKDTVHFKQNKLKNQTPHVNIK